MFDLICVPDNVLIVESISSRSRYEHEPGVTAEEDLGQSQDCQVLHSGGKHHPNDVARGARQVIT